MLAAVFLASQASAAEPVSRLPLADNNPFPIAAAVSVSAGTDLYYLSGAVPPVINKDAPKGTTAAYGDMETQANAISARGTPVSRKKVTQGNPGSAMAR